MLYDKQSGTWDTRIIVNRQKEEITNLKLAVDKNGNAFASWATNYRALDYSWTYTFQYATFDVSTGRWSLPQYPAYSSDSERIIDTELLVDEKGNAHIFYSFSTGNGNEKELWHLFYDGQTSTFSSKKKIWNGNDDIAVIRINKTGQIVVALKGMNTVDLYAYRPDHKTWDLIKGFSGDYFERINVDIDAFGNIFCLLYTRPSSNYALSFSFFDSKKRTWMAEKQLASSNDVPLKMPGLIVDEIGNGMIFFEDEYWRFDGQNKKLLAKKSASISKESEVTTINSLGQIGLVSRVYDASQSFSVLSQLFK